jgi:hypothetical protein
MKKAFLSLFTLVAALLVHVAVLFGGTIPAFAQNPNPQRSFAAQVALANPSLVLNFNDPTSSFIDKVSGLTFSGVHPTSYSPVPNSQTYAGYFDGSTDTITTNTATTALNPATVTVSGWVNFTNFNNDYQGLFSNGGQGIQMMFRRSGKIAFYILCSGGTVGGVVGTATLVTNTWYFVSMTYDSTNGQKVYVNGVLDSSAAANGTPNVTSGTSAIGWQTSSQPARKFAGAISNVTVYGVALTPTQINTLYTGGTISSGLVGQWKLNEGSGTTAIDSSTSGLNGTWAGTPSGSSGYYGSNIITSGTVIPRQTGFDLTQPGNTSAAFPYNGWNAAPNNTIGAIEWNAPWSMVLHIDRLNWNRTGTMVLASKGDSSSNANSWWKLTLAMDATYGNDSTLCFARNSPGPVWTSGAGAGANDGICTLNSWDALPNGQNYDIVITDNGTGAAGYANSGPKSLSMSINGLFSPSTTFSNTYGSGFGYAVVNVSGGTGYANSTSFTSTGGGVNCTVTGTMAASGGVPTANGLSAINNGCTSAPTIVLTSPTGTGAVFTTSASGTLMNSATLPLMAPGAVKAGVYNGIDQSDNTQTSTYVDEFAIFPGVINGTASVGMYTQTKFYQTILGPPPAIKKNIIIDEDGCGDIDDAMVIAMAIRYHLLGYANLLGIVSESGGTDAAMFRQMLDQAGLNNVPMSVSSGATGSGFCSAADITAYNASTPQTVAAYPLAAPMYRKIFAANPTTPVYVLLGGPFTGMSDFMKSAADGISSLTGQQLFNQNATNGAYMVAQGLGCTPTSPPNTVPCSASIGGDNSMNNYLAGQQVINNNGIEPIYWTGGIPANSGPGMFSTRTSKDPIYLEAVTHASDARHCFDCMAVTELLTNYFVGGVELGVSGGTGYANATAFTSTGGGTGCSVTGFMLASAGVPSGTFQYSWGANVQTAAGIGAQCLTAPTIVLTAPTGVNALVTAYPTSVCGTFTITSTTVGNVTSASCSHHYFQPMTISVYEPGGTVAGAAFKWFTNALLNPSPVGQPRVR